MKLKGLEVTLTEFAKRAEKITVDNSPLILTAIGVTGTITTAYLTAKATFKAAELILIERQERDYVITGRALEYREEAKVVWKLYIPATVTGALTIGAIIGANRIGTRRAAAMAAAYTISERAFDEYKEKIVEKLGEKKERAARDEIAQDRVDKNPVGKTEVIITGGGDVLCFDAYTGRYFYSDMETLKKAQNDVNYGILNNGYGSLNDFYSKIGLANITLGEEVGWSYESQLEIHFTTTLSDDQRPCISINFVVMPVREYYKFH